MEKSDSFYNVECQGVFGDACHTKMYADLDALPDGTQLNLGKLKPGYRIDDVKLVTEALGASTTLKLGLLIYDADGNETLDDVALLGSGASASAGARRSDKAPIELDYGGCVILTLGGGSGSGRVDATVMGVYQGK